MFSILFPEASRPSAAARVEMLASFNQFVLQCQDNAYTLACYLLGSEAQAEAVTQAAVAAAYRQYCTRGGDGRLLILAQVVQACGQHIRRSSRKPIPVTNRPAAPASIYALQALPTVERQALVLVDILGLSYAEAAMTSARPVREVRHALSQARMKIG